jgi:hypothetical protein
MGFCETGWAHRSQYRKLPDCSVDNAQVIADECRAVLHSLPGPVLWGIMAGLLRFVPYVAAAGPVLLAAMRCEMALRGHCQGTLVAADRFLGPGKI